MHKENLVYTFETALRTNWNLVAFSDNKGENKLSYQQVAEKIMRLHMAFSAAGIKKGNKVAIIGKNTSFWALTYLASISYGAVVVPVIPELKTDDMHHIVNHSDASILFADDQAIEQLDADKMPRIKAIMRISDFSVVHHRIEDLSLIARARKKFDDKYGNGIRPSDVVFPDVSKEDAAVILYTSGTTGTAKGVVIQHKSIFQNIFFAQQNIALKPGETVVSHLSLAHSFGCIFEFLFPFTRGCHIVFTGKILSEKTLINVFRTHHPALVVMVPQMMEKLYKNFILPYTSEKNIARGLRIPLVKQLIHQWTRKKIIHLFGDKFREILIGGSHLNPEVESVFLDAKIPLSMSYGMTECSPMVTYNRPDTYKARSAGTAAGGVEIVIDSVDPYNIPGEILVRGDYVMLGYYKNPDATRQIIDVDDWLHTGDAGTIDKTGHLFVKGRLDHAITVSEGKKIFPEEIEMNINSLDYIRESIVVHREDGLYAWVYPDYPRADKDRKSHEELESIIKDHLPAINEGLQNGIRIKDLKIQPEEFEKTPKQTIKRFIYK
ncbi:MAG: AMP-binding protein [Cyclobacteriaceae bacterium]|nr:AMP-binding protein [Cyclobacteriaceae bacterium]